MLLTIGLPIFNSRSTVLEAVRSVFAQTFHDWELLLVDDGSTDGSVELLRQIRDPRVRVFVDGTHRGLVARLNQIAREARGDFVARMDADDLMDPERCRWQIEQLLGTPGVDVSSTGVLAIDEAGHPIGVRGLEPLDVSPRAILTRGAIIHASVIARRDWMLAHPYDRRFPRAEDRELWIRTCSSSTFAKVCRPLYFVREIGRFVRDKFLASYHTERRILKKYGPSTLGRFGTATLLARSYLKSGVVVLLEKLGWASSLMARHQTSLTESERQAFERTIETIRHTPIPGVDHD